MRLKCTGRPGGVECNKDGVVHLMFRPVIREGEGWDATYTGASYCSWAHLKADMDRLPESFAMIPELPENADVDGAVAMPIGEGLQDWSATASGPVLAPNQPAGGRSRSEDASASDGDD